MKIRNILIPLGLLSFLGCQPDVVDKFPRNAKVPITWQFQLTKVDKLNNEVTVEQQSLSGGTVQLTATTFIVCQPWQNIYMKTSGSVPDYIKDQTGGTCQTRFLTRPTFLEDHEFGPVVCDIVGKAMRCAYLIVEPSLEAYANPWDFPEEVVSFETYIAEVE
jgi:hypothetical protein